MGTITAAALINIKEAARQVGLNPEDIVQFLSDTYASDGITWDDGSAAASASQLQSFLRGCFNEGGEFDEKADQFIAAIVALDTGIVGANVAPDLEGAVVGAAYQLAWAQGFELAITSVTDLGNFPIGEVDDQQSPASTTAGEAGDTITAEIQLGQLIPANEDVAIHTVIAALDALGLTLTDVGAAVSGTTEADDDLTTITTHGLVDLDRVVITALTGGTGLTLGGVYWVRDRSGDTFKLAASEDGTAINITLDASAITLRDITDLVYITQVDDEALEDVALSVPVAGSYLEYAAAVLLSPVGGAVPDWTTGGSGDGGVLDNTEMDTAIAAAGVGLVGDGTEQSDASTNGTVLALTNHTIGQVLPPGQKVEYTYSGT